MKKLFLKTKNQKGYALLFTVLIISSISVVAAGLINAVYKQLILSLLAKDSSSAFYQADTAVDCAMYADLYASTHGWLEGDTLNCGGFDLNIIKHDDGSYDLLPPDEKSNEPCFRINVSKNSNSDIDGFNTESIKAKGYNICNMTNSKTVEREIVVNFKE